MPICGGDITKGKKVDLPPGKLGNKETWQTYAMGTLIGSEKDPKFTICGLTVKALWYTTKTIER